MVVVINKCVSLQMHESLVRCEARPHIGVVCINRCIHRYRLCVWGHSVSHLILHLHLNLMRWVGLYSQELLWKSSQVPRCMSPKTCKVTASHRVGVTAAMAVDKSTASV